MTGKGTISITPARRLKVIIGFQVLWFCLVMGLGLWWTNFALRQSLQIEELQRIAGISGGAQSAESVRRMLYWESGTYLVLLGVASSVLLWLYWRERNRSRSLQAFFASVTHELRTPLTSIRLQAESIAEAHSGPLVARLLEDTLRLESQVERTLELARIEGGARYHMQRLRLKPFLARLVQPWSETSDLKIVDKTDDVEIMADVSGLSVILRNVLENALRHTTKTPVTVMLETQRESGFVKLVISDDGGRKPEEGAKLGRLYEKGAHSKGAGVGLYLVSQLALRMDAEVSFGASSQGFQVVLKFQGATHE